MNIYDDMREAVRQEIRQNSGQGTMAYIHPGEPTGPAYDPVIGPETIYSVDGQAWGVSEKYLSDGYVTASDLEVRLGL